MDSNGSRELGIGLTYALHASNYLRYFAFSADYSDLKVTVGTSNFTVRQITLGSSYQF
jgi:hypothetical protein